MKKSTRKKVVATVLSLALLLQVTPTFAAPTVSPTYDKKIEDLQTKIEKFDNDITISIDKVDRLNKQVEESKQKVEKTKKEIIKLEDSYNRSLELSQKRLEQIQMNGSTSFNFVEVLLTSQGISDFVQKTSAVITVMESDKELTETLLKKDEELKEKKNLLDKELESIKTKQVQAQKEKVNIEKAKKTVLADLEEVKKAKKQAEEAARKAEEERRKAAEAAARANEAQTRQQTQTQVTAPTNTNSNNNGTSDNSNNNTSKPSNENSTIEVPTTSGSAAIVIAEAKKYLGLPYKWGGTTPSGFDCSGFTSYVFRKAGVSLPRVSRDQQNFGKKISKHDVQPGDLVFKGLPAYHVGIYIGGGKYIHSPRTGDVVKISSYNPSKFSSATRVLN